MLRPHHFFPLFLDHPALTGFLNWHEELKAVFSFHLKKPKCSNVFNRYMDHTKCKKRNKYRYFPITVKIINIMLIT